MTIVVDIRGTHGSGKSYIPKELLRLYAHRQIVGTPLTYEGKQTLLGYEIPELNLRILGKYHNACGGCDGIRTQDEIRARVEAWRGTHNVMLEGILVAHTYAKWAQFAKGKNWWFFFLDTPLPVCIARVDYRRQNKGQEPLADPRNIIRDHKRINSLHQKFTDDGLGALWLDYKDPVNSILGFIRLENRTNATVPVRPVPLLDS